MGKILSIKEVKKPPLFTPGRIASGFLAAALGGGGLWLLKEAAIYEHEPIRVVRSEVQIGNRSLSNPFGFIKPLASDNSSAPTTETKNAWVDAARERPSVAKNFLDYITPEKTAQAKKSYQRFLADNSPVVKFKALQRATTYIGAYTDVIGVSAPNFMSQLRDAAREALPLLLNDIKNNPEDTLSNLERMNEAMRAFHSAGKIGIYDDSSGFSGDEKTSESNTGLSKNSLYEQLWEVRYRANKIAKDRIETLMNQVDLSPNQIAEFDRLDEIFLNSHMADIAIDEGFEENLRSWRFNFYNRYEVNIDEVGNRTVTVKPPAQGSSQPSSRSP